MRDGRLRDTDRCFVRQLLCLYPFPHFSHLNSLLLVLLESPLLRRDPSLARRILAILLPFSLSGMDAREDGRRAGLTSSLDFFLSSSGFIRSETSSSLSSEVCSITSFSLSQFWAAASTNSSIILISSIFRISCDISSSDVHNFLREYLQDSSKPQSCDSGDISKLFSDSS